MKTTISKLYQDYLKEYRGQCYITNEFGFITYVLQYESESIFIQDIYIDPPHRGQGKTKELIESAIKLGQEAGMSLMVSLVYMASRDKEISLKCALSTGAKIVSMDAQKIILSRRI